MKKFKTQKGITLVALIITIIILLILAVVALREITGDGIIAKAKEARSEYEEAQADENRLLAEYMTYLNNANSDGSGGNTGGNGGSTGGNEVNPWLSTDLASLPNSIYDTWYTGPMPEVPGLPPNLSLKISSSGEFIVPEGGLYSKINDDTNNKLAVNGNTITYTDSESMIVSAQFSEDGQKITISVNGTPVGQLEPPNNTNTEEKIEILSLINKARLNPTAENKNALLAIGIDIDNCISVSEKIPNGSGYDYKDYFYSKGTKNLLFTDNQIIDVTEEQLATLNDLYEIALLVEQQLETREQGDTTSMTVTYKGETIVGYWQAMPWCFEYGGWTLEWVSPRGFNSSLDILLSDLVYVGCPGL